MTRFFLPLLPFVLYSNGFSVKTALERCRCLSCWVNRIAFNWLSWKSFLGVWRGSRKTVGTNKTIEDMWNCSDSSYQIHKIFRFAPHHFLNNLLGNVPFWRDLRECSNIKYLGKWEKPSVVNIVIISICLLGLHTFWISQWFYLLITYMHKWSDEGPISLECNPIHLWTKMQMAQVHIWATLACSFPQNSHSCIHI